MVIYKIIVSIPIFSPATFLWLQISPTCRKIETNFPFLYRKFNFPVTVPYISLSKSIRRSLYSMILPAPLRFIRSLRPSLIKLSVKQTWSTYSWHPASYPSNISSSSSFAVRKMTGIDLYFKSFLQKSIPEVPGSPISAIMTSGFYPDTALPLLHYMPAVLYILLYRKIFLALHSFEHRLRLIEFSSCTPFNLIMPIIPHPQTTCQSVTATQFIIILSALLRSPACFDPQKNKEKR